MSTHRLVQYVRMCTCISCRKLPVHSRSMYTLAVQLPLLARWGRTLHVLTILSFFSLELDVLFYVPSTSIAMTPSVLVRMDPRMGNLIAVSGGWRTDTWIRHAAYVIDPVSSPASDRLRSAAGICYCDRQPAASDICYFTVVSDLGNRVLSGGVNFEIGSENPSTVAGVARGLARVKRHKPSTVLRSRCRCRPLRRDGTKHSASVARRPLRPEPRTRWTGPIEKYCGFSIAWAEWVDAACIRCCRGAQ